MSNLVLMATIGRPQGIKGDVRAFVHAESGLVPRGPVVLRKANEPDRKLTLTHIRPHTSEKGGNAVCTFEEIKDRTQIEALHQASLYVMADALPPLDDDAVYLHDMLGLTVVLHDSGKTLGVLDHVAFHGGQEIWSILTPDGKEVLLPAVPEFVNDIDLTKEIIRITPPLGLLDLYLD